MPRHDQRKQQTIVFDLGGVLIDWNPKYLYRKMFEGDEDKVDYFINNICSQEWNIKQDVGRPFSVACEELIEKYPEYTPFIRAYFDRYREMIGGAIAGTVDVLSNLREKGYSICALSNWSAETFAQVRDDFEFLNWFDALVISGHVKLAKPDPAIYKLLLNRIDREAQECLFIDDSEQNILAANQLGFQTIHFSSSESLDSELRERELI